MMGGRIWVESAPGAGSVFHFRVRFELQPQAAPRRMFHADELGGKRLLVVDDNASAREILATMSRHFGLSVDAVAGASEAIEAVGAAVRAARPYDVILMDWRMPGIDGVRCVQLIEEQQLGTAPAIVMVTAYGRDEALREAARRGVTLRTLLAKPVTSSSLLEAIGEALGQGHVMVQRTQEKLQDTTAAMAKLRGARVLLVEDNDLNQEVATELLTGVGMTVVLAGTAWRRWTCWRAIRPSTAS